MHGSWRSAGFEEFVLPFPLFVVSGDPAQVTGLGLDHLASLEILFFFFLMYFNMLNLAMLPWKCLLWFDLRS